MLFKKEWLQDLAYDDIPKSEAEKVMDQIKGKSRWSIHHRLVFRIGNKFYETSYSIGATESQDELPFEYADAEVECPEVVPFERIITDYKQVGGDDK